jgi:regulator of RNase E activity RraA
MKEQDCRTIAFEVGMQNGGLATGIALEMGKISTVGLAPAIFGPWMNISGSSLATWWRDKSIKKTIMKKILNLIPGLFLLASLSFTYSQNLSKKQMLELTSNWEGERFRDGRPKVSESILERMKAVSIEEAWVVLKNEGYLNQFEGNWQPLHDNSPFVGRALTVQYMPNRPDISDQIKKTGLENGEVGNTNSWPIDRLVKYDVYVADGFGKIIDGTLIGDNLGNAIYAKSKTGVVFNAASRDMEGLSQIEGFNAFVKGWDPSFLKEVMLLSINYPIRIGAASVMPGDVVLAKKTGVIFIPAHLAEKVVTTSEIVRLRDLFGITRLKEGVYTPGQIDNKWSDEIEKDFSKWLEDHMNELPVPKEQIQELLKKRTW